MLDEIRGEVRGSGGRCRAGEFLAEHPEYAMAVSEAKAEGLPLTAIARWLKGKGMRGAAESATRHLKGHCGC